MRTYDAKVPGSKESEEYVESLRVSLNQLISNTLLSTDSLPLVTDVFTSTSRALDVCISSIASQKICLCTHWEHSSEVKVAEYLRDIGVVDRFVPFKDNPLIEAPWKEQAAKLGVFVSDSFVSQKDGLDPSQRIAVVVIVSHVCAKTGCVTPLEDVAKVIRSEVETCAVATGLNLDAVIIVDGAHALGNSHARIDSAWFKYIDAYVASVHKWLCGPEPCGFITRPRVADPNRVVAYDVLGKDLPSSTVSVASLAGAIASVRFISEMKHRRLSERATALKHMFVKWVRGSHYELVLSPGFEQSNMVAIRLRDGNKFKLRQRQDIELELQRHRASVCVFVESDADHMWIRIAFPFFVTARAVRRLGKVLDQLVEVK